MLVLTNKMKLIEFSPACSAWLEVSVVLLLYVLLNNIFWNVHLVALLALLES